MPSIGAAPRAAVSLSPARAEASRRNGAKSCGPKTLEGKARSSQNALKHGFRAQARIVLPSEDAAEFAALEAALMEELAPDGALQAALAQRVVSAVWRLGRAERLEAELFAENQLAGRSLGLALIRDCNGARSFDTLLRYRGTATAELWRALRTLKALQAEQTTMAPVPAASPALHLLPQLSESPIEPKSHGNPGETAPAPAGDVVAAVTPALPEQPAHPRKPIEPEGRGNPGDPARPPAAAEPAQRPGAAHGAPIALAASPPRPAPRNLPSEPENRTNPRHVPPLPTDQPGMDGPV